MRRKKHKHTRRSVAFYKVHHGFREPYKVLLDGNFIHATLGANITQLADAITNLLGGTCKLFTTPCISHELKSMGADTAAAAAAARRQQLHKCEHDPCKLPAECLLEQVRRGNPDHWFIATQDKALQAQVARRTGVPLVFASVNGLHLADPPEQAKAAIAATQAADQVLPAHERTTGALKDLDELKPKDESWKKFKRKKTKGPNPLSVKKKQKKGPQQQQHRPKGPGGSAPAAVAGGGGDGASSEAAAAAKKRKRKKVKQPKQQPAADGGAAGGE